MHDERQPGNDIIFALKYFVTIFTFSWISTWMCDMDCTAKNGSIVSNVKQLQWLLRPSRPYFMLQAEDLSSMLLCLKWQESHLFSAAPSPTHSGLSNRTTPISKEHNHVQVQTGMVYYILFPRSLLSLVFRKYTTGKQWLFPGNPCFWSWTWHNRRRAALSPNKICFLSFKSNKCVPGVFCWSASLDDNPALSIFADLISFTLNKIKGFTNDVLLH